MQVYHLLSGQGPDGLVFRQAEKPRPGPGQALVKMRAASLNYRDLRVAEGRYALGILPENIVPLSDEGFNYITSPDWHEQAMALTGGRGVDHVIEVVGGENVAQSVEATRNGGTVHLIGAQKGGLIAPTRVQRRNVTMRGLYVGSRAHFESRNVAIAQHVLRPVIDRVFPFSEAKAAYQHLESQRQMGKVVITLGGQANT